jgi:hypothetical protein
MEDVTTRQAVIQKPSVNNNMGGIDRNDGQLQSYNLVRECLKKYYKKKGGTISRLDFLLILAESLSLVGGVVEPSTRGHLSNSPVPS